MPSFVASRYAANVNAAKTLEFRENTGQPIETPTATTDIDEGEIAIVFAGRLWHITALPAILLKA